MFSRKLHIEHGVCLKIHSGHNKQCCGLNTRPDPAAGIKAIHTLATTLTDHINLLCKYLCQTPVNYLYLLLKHTMFMYS